MKSTIVTKEEAKTFVRMFDLVQAYIVEIVKIAETSSVGLTEESRAIDKKLQKAYDDFWPLQEKLRELARS